MPVRLKELCSGPESLALSRRISGNIVILNPEQDEVKRLYDA